MFEREAKDLKPFRGFFFPADKGSAGQLEYYSNSAVQGPIGCRCTMRCNCDIAQRAAPASHFPLGFVS